MGPGRQRLTQLPGEGDTDAAGLGTRAGAQRGCAAVSHACHVAQVGLAPNPNPNPNPSPTHSVSKRGRQRVQGFRCAHWSDTDNIHKMNTVPYKSHLPHKHLSSLLAFIKSIKQERDQNGTSELGNSVPFTKAKQIATCCRPRRGPSRLCLTVNY